MNVPILNGATAVLTLHAPPGGLFHAQYIEARRVRAKSLANPKFRILCTAEDAEHLLVFPEIMVQAGARLAAHSRVRDVLAKEPLLATRLLLEGYDEAHAVLESDILRNPEALVPLLRASDEGRIRLSRQRKEYEQALLAEPYWALNYIMAPCQNKEAGAAKEKLFARLREFCRSSAETNPQAALVHLTLNPGLSAKPYVPTMCRDAMTAYLASRTLAVRGFDATVDLVQCTSARWATHIALWGAFLGGNVSEHIENCIAEQPEWAGEYIAQTTERHNDWPWIAGIFAKVNESYGKTNRLTQTLLGDLLWAMVTRMSMKLEGRTDYQMGFFELVQARKAETENPPAAPQT